MKKYLYICIVFMVYSSCGVTVYNQTQYAECFAAYDTAHNQCKGDEECQRDALNAYKSCTGENLEIPVHFVLLTDKLWKELGSPSDEQVVIEFLKREIDTLNRNFTAEDSRYPPDNRYKFVTFTYKSSTLYKKAKKINDAMITTTGVATPTFNFDKRHDDFKPLLNNGTNSNLYDPEAVNVYIADCVDDSGNDIWSSHGNNNGNKPYVVIDYARITGVRKNQAVQEHEMGHAFGLGHECHPGADEDTDTNIMASKDNCFDSSGKESGGGKRNIGFNVPQCRIILEKIDDFLKSIN